MKILLEIMRQIRLIMAWLLILNLACAPIGVPTLFSITGKEARERLQEYFLLDIVFLNAGLTSEDREDPLVQIGQTYLTTFYLLTPFMLEIDDDAYYSERDVQKCAQRMSIFGIALLVGPEIALFTCDLEPLEMVDIGSPEEVGE